MLTPFLTPVLQPALRPAIGDIAQAVQRYFTTLSAAAGQYYQFSSPINLGADFEIEFDVLIDALPASGNATFFSGASQSNNEIAADINLSGTIRFIGYENLSLLPLVSVFGAGIDDGKLHILRFSLQAGLASIYIDGVEQASATWGATSSPKEVQNIGRRPSGGSQFSGLIANFKAWTGGDRDTGTQIVDMPLDESWQSSAVARNRAIPKSSELILNNTFEGGTSGWAAGSGATLSASNNVLTVTSAPADTFSNANQGFVTEAGKSYLVSIQVGNTVGASSTPIGISSTPTGARDILNLDTTLSNITKTGIFTGTGSVVYIFLGVSGEGASADFLYASVREVQHYATAINITSADAERYTQSTEFNGWISNTELVTQADWESPYVKNAGWTYDAGENTWNLVGDGSLQIIQPIVNSAQPEYMYLKTNIIAFESVTSGALLIFTNTATPKLAESSGIYEMVIGKATSIGQQYKRQAGGQFINATLAKPSLRKFLPLGAA